MDWIRCSEEMPPQDVEVMTKIDDGEGERNEQTLVRHGRLWFVDTALSMYVYYDPTHWKEPHDA